MRRTGIVLLPLWFIIDELVIRKSASASADEESTEMVR
jgi:hypothetical protein